jgi:RHS repeat-associated protein
MKRIRHNPEQIINKLREADAMLGAGKSIAHVVQHLGVSEQMYHRWRNQFGGMKAEEARRLGTSYTPRGQVARKWQEDEHSTIVDDTSMAYDGWGNLTKFEQDVDSEIGADLGRDEFEVAYTYAKATPAGGRPMVRRTGMTSTAGANISYEYLSSGNSLDDAAGRVSRVKQGSVVVARYQYLGHAQVVGTELPEPDFFSHLYDGTGQYTRADRFGRPIHNIWQRNTGNINNPAPHFFDIQIAWDEASNIVSMVDNVHILRDEYGDPLHNLFDKLATNDPLGRLLRLQEGNLSSSSITTLMRDERWQDTGGSSALSQTGNQFRYRRDDTGSGTFTMDDTRTYNRANELLTRDVNSNSTVDYELTYNAVGNLIADGEHYAFTYDPRGFLTEVRNQSDALVARYTYNAWGFRTTWQYDVMTTNDPPQAGPDGQVNSDDPIYCSLFDMDWRPAGTFRYPNLSGNAGKSEPAKERFVYNNAGIGGFGRSSYIDSLILRDTSGAWTSAATGTFTQRICTLANFRGDTVLVVTGEGTVIEWVSYSAYGVPFLKPAFDLNSDGSADETDLHLGNDWLNRLVYDVRLDPQGTGEPEWISVDMVSYGRGILSSVNNRIGYAGYQHAPELAGTKYHVRHRAVDAERGEWLTRDPAGDIDGPNRYQYVRSQPLLLADPEGRVAILLLLVPAIKYGVPIIVGVGAGAYLWGNVNCTPGEYTWKTFCRPCVRMCSILKGFTTEIICNQLVHHPIYAPELRTGQECWENEYVCGSSGIWFRTWVPTGAWAWTKQCDACPPLYYSPGWWLGFCED